MKKILIIFYLILFVVLIILLYATSVPFNYYAGFFFLAVGIPAIVTVPFLGLNLWRLFFFSEEDWLDTMSTYFSVKEKGMICTRVITICNKEISHIKPRKKKERQSLVKNFILVALQTIILLTMFSLKPVLLL